MLAVPSILIYDPSVSLSAFPNLFILGGPSHFVIGSQFLSAENTVQYICRVLRHILPKAPITSTTVTPIIRPRLSAEKAYDNDIQRWLQKFTMNATPGVNNWMVDKETGKNFLAWPGSNFSFWWRKSVKPVNWKDWVVT